MTIIEALKTGKRVRRPNWGIYYSFGQEEFFELSSEDILAEDWEVETLSVKISFDQFDVAWDRAAEILVNREEPYETFKTILKRELGL